MKRILLCVLLLLILTGCEKKINKEEYDILKGQLDNLQYDYDSLESQNKELQSKYDVLTEENGNLQLELAKKTVETFTYDTNIVVEAWGKAAFGDSTKCYQKSEDTAEYDVIIDGATNESLTNFFKQLNENMGTLALVTSTQEIKYVSIKAIDNSNPIFELYLDSTGNKDSKTQMMINTDYTDIVKNAVISSN